ncbi:hypothetical protein [Inquilinus sp. CA228]|uniref:hypothetical protein n=1 Tax=Inquilinus sp. CA228 TaxID=3455609 RepID=UPI003F8D3B16
MIQIHLDMSEVVAVAQALERAPEMVDAHFLPAVWEASFLAQREIVERTPRAFSTLADSIQAREPEIGVSAIVGVVGTPLAYAEPVELGSRPHMPPLQPLMDWVKAKLGKPADQVEPIAQAIRWKIYHHGTKGAFMFREGLKAVQPQVERIMAEAVRGLIAELAGLGKSGGAAP